MFGQVCVSVWVQGIDHPDKAAEKSELLSILFTLQEDRSVFLIYHPVILSVT